MSFQIAHIDKNKKTQEMFRLHLASLFPLTVFENPLAFLESFENERFPLVFSRSDLQPINGVELFEQIEKASPGTIKFLLTNGNGMHQENGHPFPTIPLSNSEKDIELIKTHLDRAVIEYRGASLMAPSASHLAPDIVGNSMQLQNQLHYARTIAGFNEPVLITGDTGTGKDLIAKYIHYHSNRQSHPLHIVNCGAINPELFESEFFGHVKGAYTGATGDHAGHFAKANQGTLVLDEVTEMDLKFQVKLLRAIENQEVYPVGSQKMIRLNTRIIALTNRNIREQIQQGRFREDLYYRLNRYHLHLTPLCERPRDIQPLGEYYIGKSWFSTVNEWRSQIDPQVYELLKQMKLPGNVRDLQNLILKVISYKRPSEPFLSCADFERVIDQSDLIASPSSLPVDQLNTYLTNAERTRILETLSTNDFNISNAAKQLGVSRQNLQHRMKRLNIRNPVHG